MQMQSNLQIYQMFCSLFISISKGQLILDSIKQILATIPLFHPLVLFKYLTKDSPILLRKHLIQFLEQNNYHVHQEDIKIIFSFEGIKDKMNYTSFLKMIYPSSMIANRQINTVHLKNYHQTQNISINQEILAAFYLFLTEQIKFINRIQVQKQDTVAKIPKQKIHKVVKNIKKLSQKNTIHCQKNNQVITSLQLIYFVKNFTDIDEKTLFYLFRRLDIDHLGCVSIEKLQSFLKPWKKNPSIIENSQNKKQNMQGLKKQKFNEEKYRKQLNSQLSRNISYKKNQNLNLSKRKNRKDGTIKIKQGQNQQKLQHFERELKQKTFKKSPLRQNKQQIQNLSYKKNNKEYQPNGINVKLFIKFISTFLKNSAQIQKLRAELNQIPELNYLKIFKRLDRYERGVIKSEQLQNFYKDIGGINVSINFNVLVEAFSQTGQNWLSYSQFCQIFKPSIQRSQRSLSSTLRLAYHDKNKYLAQVLYLTLLNEYQLLQIRRQFKKNQVLHLFSLINKENTGFINYQELKKFLITLNFTNLSMYDLMIILKKLDHSKNGVVSENQFLDYFTIEM